MTVDVQVATDAAGIPAAGNVGEWVERTTRAAGPGGDFDVSIRIVDAGEMQALNRDYRDQDKPTNVLAFPAGDAGFVPPGERPLLGDIVVCAGIVADEAAEQGGVRIPGQYFSSQMNDKPPSTSGTGSTSLIARLKRAIKGEPWSREEIHDIIQQSETDIDAEEKSMLAGVLEVSETQVRDVMIPRSQMVVIDIEDDIDEMIKVIVESGHSRFPVMGEDRDEVLGVLLAKDLLRYFGRRAGQEVPIRKLLRPAAVIPESKRLNALLKEFRASHNHMAIVVDEYGGVSGLLTIEDVLEEIVGEIDDEHDPEEDAFIRSEGDRDGRPSFAVRALTRIEDFNEFFECELSDEEYDTVGGLVMHELGRLPRRGESIDFGGFEFSVTKADKRRIGALRVQRLAV
jgi:magnesium and cobalt transporter